MVCWSFKLCCEILLLLKMVDMNEVRCYEAQIEESEKGQQPPGVEPRTPLA